MKASITKSNEEKKAKQDLKRSVKPLRDIKQKTDRNTLMSVGKRPRNNDRF